MKNLQEVSDTMTVIVLFVEDPTYAQVLHKPFFYCGYQAHGQSPHWPGSFKNALGPLGILLKRGASCACR